MTEDEEEKMRGERSIERAKSIQTIVWERYKLLPQISALAATLLVVATFNKEAIPLTNLVRFLLIIFLLLIPVSLMGYLWALHRAKKHAFKEWQEIYENLVVPYKKLTGIDRVLALLPDLIGGFISLAILVIVFLVAKGFFCKAIS